MVTDHCAQRRSLRRRAALDPGTAGRSARTQSAENKYSSEVRRGIAGAHSRHRTAREATRVIDGVSDTANYVARPTQVTVKPTPLFPPRGFGARSVGSSVRRFQCSAERRTVDPLQVATGCAHPAPAARNGRYRVWCQRAEVLLLLVVEHEIQVPARARQRRKDTPRRAKRDAIEVRRFTCILERERKLTCSLRRDGHPCTLAR
jgi:hypothetical protein